MKKKQRKDKKSNNNKGILLVVWYRTGLPTCKCHETLVNSGHDQHLLFLFKHRLPTSVLPTLLFTSPCPRTSAPLRSLRICGLCISASLRLCVSASLRLCVSATPRLRGSTSPPLYVSASQRLSVSASQRLSVSASYVTPRSPRLCVLMFCQRSEQCGGQEEKKREENKTKQNKTKQNKTKQNKTTQNNTKQHKTTQNNTKQHKTTQHNTRQDKTRQDKTKQNKTKQNKKTRGIEEVWSCREWYHSCSHTANECPSIVKTIRTKFFEQVSFLSFSSPLKSAKACK